MKKYSMCILDDKIPATDYSEFIDETKIINENNFKYLLSDEEKWTDKDLLHFLKSVVNEKNEYSISGFINHSFFLNYIEDNIFSPDIIVFDWDVGEVDTEQNLLTILKKKYCLIAIFSDQTTKLDIKNVISSDNFIDFKNRLFLIDKEEKKSNEKLLEELSSREKVNFSFKLGQNLKQNILQSTDNILINIGRLSFDQFISAFGDSFESSGKKRKLSNIDFIEIFTDKLKSYLISENFIDDPLISAQEKIDNDYILKRIWHFRLYHKPKDNIVRKGDIIKKNNSDHRFLVVTSDCHLNQFWSKNLGQLNLVPLYNPEDVKSRIKEFNNNYFKIKSMVNVSGIESITMLPALILDEDNSSSVDYALFPKEVYSIEIKMPKDVKSNQPLLYDYFDEYDGSDRIRLSEPFLSPLTQFILSKIADYGVPDYSKELQDILKTHINEKD